jgi:hypothetical protein
MSIFTQFAKKMLAFGALFLTGCASAPTLDFVIAKDKVIAFNECMVPLDLQGLPQKNGSSWLAGLREFVPKALHKKTSLDSLSASLPKILKMHYADKDKLTVPQGEEQLSVPFDMHIQKFPFIDSEIVDVVEELLFSVNLSSLLQTEAPSLTDSGKAATAKPERVAKALKTYLLAYFTVGSGSEEKSGFISRDGTKFQFPVQLGTDSKNGIGTISSVDHSQIGADIIRIILEAIRDGSLDTCEALPALDESATGVGAQLLRVFTDNKECSKGWGVPSEAEFSKMQAHANAAESLLGTAAGKAIRGGTLGSLNNEALARAAETAVGVIARHTAERVEWCKASIK